MTNCHKLGGLKQQIWSTKAEVHTMWAKFQASPSYMVRPCLKK
jgi:hypothetical protein